MSIYILFHIVFFIVLLFLGISVYKKYKKSSGIYFLLFTIFTSIWLFFYSTVIFSDSYTKETILIVMKVMFLTGFLLTYCMLFFVWLFDTPKIKIKNITRSIHAMFGIVTSVILFTPFIIKDVEFNENLGYYLEVYGDYYYLLAIAHFLFIPLFGFVSYFKIKALRDINKMRLKYICIGFYIFIIISLLFLVFLPYFGYVFIENSIGILLLPFILATFYSIHTYNFSNLKLQFGKIIVFILSSFWGILTVTLVKKFYSSFGESFIKLWGISSSYGTFDLLLGIIFFFIFYKIFTFIFLGNGKIDVLELKLSRLKREIPYITNLHDLNEYLSHEMNKILKIRNVGIKIFNKNEESELMRFFSEKTLNSIFVNDIVFIEENKNKFDQKSILKQIDKDAYLIFPIYESRKVIAYFEIGKKPFRDDYTTEEIKILKDFVGFLEGHLKYIEIYKKIHDLSVNLDKKVDRKTMEYNNLLNKQKEFISVISHEIKSPLSSAIFQADSLLDDLNAGNISHEILKSELGLLNDQLIKSGELIGKLFSVQYYDTDKVNLFKEKVNVKNLLMNEIEVYSRMNENIHFEYDIDDNIGFISLDKVQFTQVIENILSNAVKFIGNNNPTIILESKVSDESLEITIEDNGEGFTGVDISTIFEKYNTGEKGAVGLGMGLYLCKKIIELHKGEISASKSKKLDGAKFTIKIPKE